MIPLIIEKLKRVINRRKQLGLRTTQQEKKLEELKGKG